MATDTYELFLSRWSQLIGAEYISAIARLPYGDSFTSVGVAPVKEHTYGYLLWASNNSNEDGRWLAEVQLLLDPSAEYVQRK